MSGEAKRPIQGVRVLELAGFGPGPFAGMLLSDLGAEVLRVDRPGGADPRKVPASDVLGRGRGTLEVDLRTASGVEFLRSLAKAADILIDPFRPGVTERWGIGPEVCCTENPRLIYLRVTGWGETGPHAYHAGHDINYLAVAGALDCIGTEHSGPVVPLNFVGDYGGGGMLTAIGALAALLEREQSGRGQVVDVAITDGIALQMAELFGLAAEGDWEWRRGSNSVDGGAPFYGVYRTADDRWIAVGAYESKFYESLMRTLGLDPGDWPQEDQEGWPTLRAQLEEIFAQRTLDEWIASFEGVDACVSPVLRPDEAPGRPQIAARGIYGEVNGILQPSPAPRFHRRSVAPQPDHDPSELLARWGVSYTGPPQTVISGR